MSTASALHLEGTRANGKHLLTLERTKNPTRRLNFEPSSYLNEQGLRNIRQLLGDLIESEIGLNEAGESTVTGPKTGASEPSELTFTERKIAFSEPDELARAVTYHRRSARRLGLLGAAS